MLSLHRCLVAEGEQQFLLTGRLTQDALENLFSQIRSKGIMHPKPVHFRMSLRLICLGQFMTVPTFSNYEADDTPHLISFVKSHKNDNSHLEKSHETGNEGDAAVFSLLCSAVATFDCCESNGFYYIAGWSVYKELQSIDCNQCKLFYSVDEPDPYLKKFRSLTRFKSYEAYPDSCATNLCHPSKLVFDLLHQTEIVFRNEVNNVIRSIGLCPEE